jgi:hypothetical protein
MFDPRFLLCALATLTTALVAEDFRPVVKVATQAFPGKTHFGVVCYYDRSRGVVEDLVRALPDGATLTVVDTRNPDQVGAAGATLILRDVQMLALLPADPLVRDGSPLATRLVGLVKMFNTTIPAFGTTPLALQNGCALALGEKTGWKLLVNPGDPRVKGVIEDITIEPVGTKAASSTRLNPVTIRLVSLAK